MRALAGHDLAWAYAFEWPLFGILGTYVWWQLVHAEAPGDPAAPSQPDGRRHDESTGPVTHPEAVVDPGLEAWQRYLGRLHEKEPPGRPPWQR